MDSVTELYVTQGMVSSHNFLHLTFQEFLTAVHISTMSPAKQLEHFKKYMDGRLNVVLQFLSGLNKMDCFTKDSVSDFFDNPPESVSDFIYNPLTCESICQPIITADICVL
jgi:phage-related tail protein